MAFTTSSVRALTFAEIIPAARPAAMRLVAWIVPIARDQCPAGRIIGHATKVRLRENQLGNAGLPWPEGLAQRLARPFLAEANRNPSRVARQIKCIRLHPLASSGSEQMTPNSRSSIR